MSIVDLVCAEINCYRGVVGRGLCDAHYRAWYRKRHPLYATWLNMKQRCYNKNHPRYGDWGGRGIRVCERWRRSYDVFEVDMSPRPPGTTLDRRDNDGDYTPENCWWAPPRAQALNSRPKRTNTSGIVGVYWVKRQKKWAAIITIDKKRHFLGHFDTIQEAAYARAMKEAQTT